MQACEVTRSARSRAQHLSLINTHLFGSAGRAEFSRSVLVAATADLEGRRARETVTDAAAAGVMTSLLATLDRVGQKEARRVLTCPGRP